MNITIDRLSKVYPNGTRALHDIDLTIESGLFGLLGPNGAGKTTLMKILVTLMKPTGGTVKIDGLDLRRNRREIRAMLGYLPQEFRMFPKLRTWEFLDYAACLAGLRDARSRRKAVDGMLDQVGLFEVRDRLTKKLSGGMKRRLGIAQALIGEPKIVIVDEPTTGLDPEERIRFRNLLSEMTHRDIIIILSTHIVGDISSTCHGMALLNDGELAFTGEPAALIDQAKGRAWCIEATGSDLELIKERYAIISTMPSETGWEVEVVAEHVDNFTARPVEPNLEHAYVYFMDYQGKERWSTIHG